MDEGYNGWVNYETWNVALWIGNDEGLYRYWDRAARLAISPERLAGRLEAEISEDFDMGGGKWGDLDSRDELNRVDWEAVAESLMEEYAEDEDEDED